MKTSLLISALLLSTAVMVYAYPKNASAPQNLAASAQLTIAKPEKPLVEVVFVLDTTSSMGGLIDAAKANIWSIARSMASAQPTPDIRIGLVAFRDRGDDYVTKVVNLSNDLDSVYATLMDFNVAGGGDGPEAVNEALFDAVHKIQWSTNPSAYQVIFLVGDAQPHMDYADDVKYPVTLKAASARGIVVNTILAGQDSATESEWIKIAGLSQGAHFKVSQGGDALALATPLDAELARLSRELDDTRLSYGDAKVHARAADKAAATEKLNAHAATGTLAQRAAFNASESGERNRLGDSDLVAAVSSGRVDLAKLDKAQLPEELRELEASELQERVTAIESKRAELSDNIKQLAEQRQQLIDSELQKDGKAERSLDYQIFDTVKAQAGKKGLTYEEAPAH